MILPVFSVTPTSPLESGADLLSDLGADIASANSAKSNGYAIFTYESLLNNSNSSTLASIKDEIWY
jgi:hypothetical protein